MAYRIINVGNFINIKTYGQRYKTRIKEKHFMENKMEIITDINQVEKYRGKLVYIETDWNPYNNGFRVVWDNSISCFSDMSRGYGATAEINKDGVHSDQGITTKDIGRGEVRIRLATDKEIEKVAPRISYGYGLRIKR
jgi:hypothetical protein